MLAAKKKVRNEFNEVLVLKFKLQSQKYIEAVSDHQFLKLKKGPQAGVEAGVTTLLMQNLNSREVWYLRKTETLTNNLESALSQKLQFNQLQKFQNVQWPTSTVNSKIHKCIRAKIRIR